MELIHTPVQIKPTPIASAYKSIYKIPSLSSMQRNNLTTPNNPTTAPTTITRPKSVHGVNNTSISSIQTLPEVSNLINELDRALEYDEQLIEKSNCLYCQIKKGGYNYRNDAFLISNYYEIPAAVKQQNDIMQGKLNNSRGGIFSLSKIAYVFFNNVLFCWIYNQDITPAQTNFSSDVLCVEQIKNTTKISFKSSESLCVFAVSTLNGVHLCSLIKCENCIRIMHSEYHIDTDSSVAAMISSENGRLFCGDALGIVWELDFNVKSFVGKRIKKIESRSWGEIIIPNIFQPSKRVKAIYIDESRHILYALTEVSSKDSKHSVISIYNLGMFGNSFEFQFKISTDDILEKEECKKQLHHTKNWTIQLLVPIERTESDILNLLVVFANGIRIYLDFGRVKQTHIKEKKDSRDDWNVLYTYKPNGTIHIHYVIFPPSNFAEGQQINKSLSIAFKSTSLDPSIVNIMEYYPTNSSKGMFLCKTNELNVKEKEIICFTVDECTIAKMRSYYSNIEQRENTEVLSKLSLIILGDILDIKELDMCLTNGECITNLLAYPLYKDTGRRRINMIGVQTGRVDCSSLFDISTSIYQSPKMFSIMTSNHLVEVIKPRVVDKVFELLSTNKYKELYNISDSISVVELCACLLHIACSEENELFYIKKLANSEIKNTDSIKPSFIHVNYLPEKRCFGLADSSWATSAFYRVILFRK